MKTLDKILGCLAGGAIGDCIGNRYENQTLVNEVTFNFTWRTSDDTQLTIATCESIVEAKCVSPENIAAKYLEWFNHGKITGVGSSTLKALRDLQVGAHWALAGRSGEYAAGNGAAMRIAPLAFMLSPFEDRMLIRDVCNITHKNDEAYTAALSVLIAVNAALKNNEEDVIALIISSIADTGVRDSFIALQANANISIQDAAKLVGASGHAVQSIPLAVFASQKIKSLSVIDIIEQLIICGGDTDTNCSIACQIIGAYIGFNAFPNNLKSKYSLIPEHNVIEVLANQILNL